MEKAKPTPPPSTSPDPYRRRREALRKLIEALLQYAKTRVGTQHGPGQMPDSTRAHEITPPQPHWAVKMLEDPRADIPLLRPIEDYPNDVDFERALGLFDRGVLGWVPYWFPREINGRKLSPQERLDWFDQALGHYAQEEWPPSGSVSSRKRIIALSLLHMLYEEDLQGIPTPDKL